MDHQAHRWKCIATCKNFSIVPLKLFLTNPAVSVTDLILCITKFIDERIVAHAQTWQKKYIIRIWCKVLIKGQQSLIKVLSRTYWNISRIIISQFILGKKTRKCFLFTNLITEDRKFFFVLPWAITKFPLLIIFIMSGTRGVSIFEEHLCLGIFKWRNEACYFSVFILSVSILQLSSFPCKISFK